MFFVTEFQMFSNHIYLCLRWSQEVLIQPLAWPCGMLKCAALVAPVALVPACGLLGMLQCMTEESTFEQGCQMTLVIAVHVLQL